MEDESQKIILEEISKLQSDSLKKKLLKVKKLTNERDGLEKHYKKDLLELQSAYDQKYLSLYELANKIIHGQIYPDVPTTDAEKYKITKHLSPAELGIPGYWKKAIDNAKYFYANERDEPVLTNLRDVRLEIKTDKKSFTIHYIFDTNIYFNNLELTKTFIYNESQDLIKVESCTINWASNDVNPTKMMKKTQKKSSFILKVEGKKDKNPTSTSQWEDVESFFTMFKTINLEDPEADADIQNEEDEAEFIKEDLLPNSLSYYLNIMPMVEGDSCDEDDEDGGHHHGHGHNHGHKKEAGEGKEKCKNQ